jgi:hypothetical protein
MPKAPRTYRRETPEATSAGLDGHAVREDDADTHAGRVSALVERDDEPYVVAERGPIRTT